MAALLGLALGCGLFLLWWSLWSPPTEKPGAARPDSRLRVLIAQSGIQRLSPAGVVSATAASRKRAAVGVREPPRTRSSSRRARAMNFRMFTAQ